MEPANTSLSILEQVKQYLGTRFNLWKLEAADQASGITAELVTDLVLFFLGVITFLLLSIALALFAASLLKSNWQGFGCVTLLYLLIVFSAHLFKASLRDRFIRLLVKKMFRSK